MNVLYICHEYPPAKLVGGIGVFVRNIARQLVKHGNKVTVIGLYRQQESTDEFQDGVRVIRIAAREMFKVGWLIQRRLLARKIREIHKEIRFDIVETSDFDAGFWLLPKLDMPFVVRLNGGETYFRTLLQEPLQWRHRYRESASIRKADAICAVSDFTWRETMRLFGLNGKPKVILPNPVDTSFFKPGDAERIVDGRIVYSGTFIRKKGVLTLFQSLPAVFEEIPNAHLVCVGGDAKDMLTGSVSTRELAFSLIPKKYHDRVQFVGKVPHDEVLSYIQRANVCVYPSYLEAFPNAWIEAMACGKAVIGGSTGSGPEVIRDYETGLLCHPSDYSGLSERIIQLLSDRELCFRLGENARQYTVENLDIEQMMLKNVEWYQHVIDNSKK